jgi:hypothetical protein
MTVIHALLSLYKLLLYLYPRRFRDEFAREMQVVLENALAGAAEAHLWAALDVFWRELRGLPRAVVIAHLGERRRMMGSGRLYPVPLLRPIGGCFVAVVTWFIVLVTSSTLAMSIDEDVFGISAAASDHAGPCLTIVILGGMAAGALVYAFVLKQKHLDWLIVKTRRRDPRR